MTKVESAALQLAQFLRKNCPPDEVIGSQDEEWPVSIVVDNEECADQLSDLLSNLEAELKTAGYMADKHDNNQSCGEFSGCKSDCPHWQNGACVCGLS